jgi:hypothetical protein
MTRSAEFLSTGIDRSRDVAKAGVQDGAHVDLFWLPLGAGSIVVRASGWVFERLSAHRYGRTPEQLYHSALQVQAGASTWVIEMTPALRRPQERGVVATGPVGSRWPRRTRAYCYEVRRWKSGAIGDVAAAVSSPRRVSSDLGRANEVLALAEEVPTFTWGRDEPRAADMWNSNSLTAWLLARSGHDMALIAPPPHGSAPGWSAGLVVACRDSAEGVGRPRGGAGTGLPLGQRGGGS